MKNIFDTVFPKEKITLDNGKVVFRPRSKTPLITIIVIFLMYISVKVTGFNFEVFKNFGNFFNILKGMIPPDFSYSKEVITPLFDTIKMSLMGSFLGALVSLPVAILASSNITKNKFVNGFFKLFLSILRTLPSLVCALIATYIWILVLLQELLQSLFFHYLMLENYCMSQLKQLIWVLLNVWNLWDLLNSMLLDMLYYR